VSKKPKPYDPNRPWCYRAVVQLGWDKSITRSFVSIDKAVTWIDMMKGKFEPGQIIDRRIVREGM
jgi:hypothetical protein